MLYPSFGSTILPPCISKSVKKSCDFGMLIGYQIMSNHLSNYVKLSDTIPERVFCPSIRWSFKNWLNRILLRIWQSNFDRAWSCYVILKAVFYLPLLWVIFIKVQFKMINDGLTDLLPQLLYLQVWMGTLVASATV